MVVVDDHPLIRSAMRALFGAPSDIRIIGEAGTGAEALRLTVELAPDVLLLDIQLPDITGVEVVRRLRAGGSATRVLILTGYPSDDNARALIRLGIRGYLLKAIRAEELAGAIRAVHAGRTVFDPAVTNSLLDVLTSPPAERPTKKEVAVLKLVDEGYTNQEIGRRLRISVSTVQYHLRNLFGKFGVRSRTELVHVTRAQGWLP